MNIEDVIMCPEEGTDNSGNPCWEFPVSTEYPGPVIPMVELIDWLNAKVESACKKSTMSLTQQKEYYAVAQAIHGLVEELLGEDDS